MEETEKGAATGCGAKLVGPAVVFVLTLLAFAQCLAWETSGTSALQFLLSFYVFGIGMLAAAASAVALALSFLVRTRYVVVFAVIGWVVMIVMTYSSTRPLSKFRHYVDPSAPESVEIISYRYLNYQSGPSQRTFVWKVSPDYPIQQLVDSASLKPEGSDPSDDYFVDFFDSLPSEGELQYFVKPGLSVAYHATSRTAYAIYR